MNLQRIRKIDCFLTKKISIKHIRRKTYGPIRPSIEAINQTIQSAIEQVHRAGIPTTHGSGKKRYNLYPDGRRAYIINDN